MAPEPAGLVKGLVVETVRRDRVVVQVVRKVHSLSAEISGSLAIRRQELTKPFDAIASARSLPLGMA